jgi:hypothetical protein
MAALVCFRAGERSRLIAGPLAAIEALREPSSYKPQEI